MPKYDFVCEEGHVFEAVVRAHEETIPCACGALALKQPHYHTLTLQVPKAFQTSKEMVMGAPGSPQRDEFEAKIRKGEIVPTGPGTRWI